MLLVTFENLQTCNLNKFFDYHGPSARWPLSMSEMHWTMTRIERPNHSMFLGHSVTILYGLIWVHT